VDDGSPVTTDYVWDTSALLSAGVNRSLPVVLDDGTNRYLYGLDPATGLRTGLVAAIDGSSVATYFLYDGVGSTTELTDEAGAVTDAYTYDVFGALRASAGSSANPWLFTGEQHDGDSGLYYLRARHYDPATGRFLGRDPWAGPASVAQTQHPYGLHYCDDIFGGIDSVDIPCVNPFGCGSGSTTLFALAAGTPDLPDLDETGVPPAGWEWRGTGPEGSSEGSWVPKGDPKGGEYIRPDVSHGEGFHYDGRDKNGNEGRYFPGRGREPK
jgi:RHS repeat-associated protein